MNKKGLSTVLTTVIIIAVVLIAATISLLAFSQPVKNIKDKALNYIEDVFGGLFSGGSTTTKNQFDQNNVPKEIQPFTKDANAGLLKISDMFEKIQSSVSGSASSQTGKTIVKNSAKLSTTPDITIQEDFGTINLFNQTLFSNLQVPKEVTAFDLQFKKDELVATIDWNVNGQAGTTQASIPLKKYLEIQLDIETNPITVPSIGTIKPELIATAALKGITSKFPIKGPGTYNISASVRIVGTKSNHITGQLEIYSGDPIKAIAKADAAIEVNIHP